MSQPYPQLETDTLFDDSPNTCDLHCLCSRCGNVIHLGDTIIRAWTEDKKEYRYHARCLGVAHVQETLCDCGPAEEGDAPWAEWAREELASFDEDD